MAGLVGDLHGRLESMRLFQPYDIQVGDLSMGYSWADFSYPRFFIDGNHERHDLFNQDAERPYEIQGNLYHIPRGFHWKGVLFIGGANSIDKHCRTELVDWFPQEEITYKQMERILSIEEEIHTVIAHDCPSSIYDMMNMNKCNGHHVPRDLQVILERLKPKRWFCGHHHRSDTFVEQDCIFRILGIEERIEFDLGFDTKEMIS